MQNLKIFFFLIFILVWPSVGQENKNSDINNHFGVKASNISGYGIYYSKGITENYRLQAMGILYYYERNKNEETETILNYDIGLELQRNIYEGESSRTYFLLGGYYYYDDDTNEFSENVNKINNSYNIGIGIGIEFDYKRVVYNFDIGYKYFDDDIDTYIDGDFSYNEIIRVTKLGAGVGIGFKF